MQPYFYHNPQQEFVIIELIKYFGSIVFWFTAFPRNSKTRKKYVKTNKQKQQQKQIKTTTTKNKNNNNQTPTTSAD